MSLSAAIKPSVTLIRFVADRRAALTAGGVALGSVLLLAAAQQLTGLHVFAIPYIATAAVLALAPGAPLAAPRAVLVSYPVAVLTALAVTGVAGHSPYATGIAVALTVLLLALFKAPHVPAVAAAAFVGLQAPGAWYLLDPMAPGVLLVLALPVLVGRLGGGYRYPVR
ncbi:HPP family protein [Kitasatospora sp. NPDC096147]|uniref:HPP family protein n=1 Tax=Kitasatospora sp. NPDC096147 TaxID=3364093 RepID=UPI00382149E3